MKKGTVSGRGMAAGENDTSRRRYDLVFDRTLVFLIAKASARADLQSLRCNWQVRAEFSLQRINAREAEITQIEAVDKGIDGAYRTAVKTEIAAAYTMNLCE